MKKISKEEILEAKKCNGIENLIARLYRIESNLSDEQICSLYLEHKAKDFVKQIRFISVFKDEDTIELNKLLRRGYEIKERINFITGYSYLLEKTLEVH
ncbi:hypothetical protein [Fructobacillus evanidus]|uniref:Uncharacterized protein n=1 Tax=Fructobacillus evanidus TaxID=3064281 RepID=A0ABM9MMM1_9LACO|nr:unnamed protein product [Fructobacillus sp. LMG 32999]CAK1222181.1 unnamed protein product [Fructobacillus sp. LMG 32999]CAK1225967.1 unnamed protein product [Fructobacillus sp. LMG 32999]CAK1226197.1 unnamed protein product [Fructobacillus sp. LMG 32999]CAK1226344.1 unnamed protein product [Fructobacillus sp. LMG 32999]